MRFIALLVLLIVSLPVQAAPMVYVGRFVNQVSQTNPDYRVDNWLRVSQISSSAYKVEGQSYTLQGDDNYCQGSFEGVASQEKGRLIAAITDENVPEDVCDLVFVFEENDYVSIQSSGNCTLISGAQCTFNGMRLQRQ
jgi:hypothetical protein